LNRCNENLVGARQVSTQFLSFAYSNDLRFKTKNLVIKLQNKKYIKSSKNKNADKIEIETLGSSSSQQFEGKYSGHVTLALTLWAAISILGGGKQNGIKQHN